MRAVRSSGGRKAAQSWARLHPRLLLLTLLLLFAAHTNAIRLPSFFSWWQREPQQQQQQQLIKLNELHANQMDPLLTSASAFEAAQPHQFMQKPYQETQVHRRPFKAIRAPFSPARPQQLLSALPKSIFSFGRLLSGANSAPQAAGGVQASVQSPVVHLAEQMSRPSLHFQAQQQQQHHQQPQPMDVGWAQSGQFAAADESISPIAEEPGKKHALGYGEVDNFQLVEGPVELEQQQPQPQRPQQVQMQQSEQVQPTRSPVDEYREMPAIVIADAEEPTNGTQQHRQLQAQRMDPSQAQRTSTGAPASSSEPGELAANETVAGQPNESPPRPSEGVQVAESAPATVADQEQQPQPQQVLAANSSSRAPDQPAGDGLLGALINGELMKLKEQPEMLNKTLREPLVAFLAMEAEKQQQQQPQPIQANQTLNVEVGQQPGELQHSLESVDAAMVLAPDDESAVQEEQQFESFVLGPYRGFAGDNSAAGGSPSPLGRRPIIAQPAELRPQQEQRVPTGMSNMATNLIQQAKSLMQLPFVHHLSSQAGQVVQSGRPAPTLRQQQIGGHALGRPSAGDLMMELSSAPEGFARTRQQTANYRQPAVGQMSIGQQQQALWPAGANRYILMSHQQLQQPQQFLQQHPRQFFQQNPHRQQQQQQQRPRPLTMAQQPQVYHQQLQMEPNAAYVSQQLNRERQPNSDGRQLAGQTSIVGQQAFAPFGGAAKTSPGGHQLSPFAQPQQLNGYQLVVNHQRAPSKQSPANQQQQQQLNQSAAKSKRFESGLYEIEPPKLAPSSGRQAEQPIIQQPQQPVEADQQIAQTDADEDDDDDNEAAEAPDAPEGSSDSASLAKQVGASIGVAAGASNQSRKGQVFSEPIGSLALAASSSARQAASPARVQNFGRRDQSAGPKLSRSRTLKVSEDVTLYDLEVPARAGEQPSGGQLDTQVYTIPYTLSVAPDGRAQLAPPRRNQPVPDSYRPHPSQLHHPGQTQLGQFALPYLAPPAPQTQSVSQAISEEQQLIESLARDFGAPGQASAQQARWAPASHLAGQQLAPISALTLQPEAPKAAGNPLSLDEVLLADGVGHSAPHQHYFHYQPIQYKPIASARPQLATYRTEMPKQQTIFELAAQQVHEGQSASQNQQQQQPQRNHPPHHHSPQQQQQFMLAIQHSGHPAASAGSSLFASTFLGPQQVQQQQQQLLQISQPAQQPPTEVSGREEVASSTEASQPSSTTAQSAVVSQDAGETAESSSQPTQRQDSQESPQSGRSPSVFCAHRAPGLYADEAQKCKAYYQCAPTGHQMFRCNNQTQFNQRTQNCDWWYNVNCGGQSASNNDALVQKQQQQFQAQFSGPNTSRQFGSGESAPLELDSVRSEEQANQSQRQQEVSRSQEDSQVQPVARTSDQDAEREMFHHSESQTNSTLSPDQSSANSTSASSLASQLRQQQFSERSSTTQDPLFSSTPSERSSLQQLQLQLQSAVSSSKADTDTEQQQQPQVGANLGADEPQTSTVVSSDSPMSSPAADERLGGHLSGSQTQAPPTTSTTTAAQTSPVAPISDSTGATTTTTTTTATAANDYSTSPTTSIPPEQQQKQPSEQPRQSARRLIQSEFGAASRGKAPRSSSRYEWTSRQQQQPMGLTGLVLAGEPTQATDRPQFAANHQYPPGSASAVDIYSTSANQGSVNYEPVDVHYLTARAFEQPQQQSSQPQQQLFEAEGSQGKRVDRRFGERLAGSGGPRVLRSSKQTPTNTTPSSTNSLLANSSSEMPLTTPMNRSPPSSSAQTGSR